MSDSSQLLKIIADVLQPQDAALRKNSEQLLVDLRNTKPNELAAAYLSILSSTISLIQVEVPNNTEILQPLSSDYACPFSRPHHTQISGNNSQLKCKTIWKFIFSKSSISRAILAWKNTSQTLSAR